MTLTVLIVDDDENFREFVKRQLGHGVKVMGEAGRGDDAVLLARDLRPDVVLMDLDLPGLDGIAATRHIKAADPRTKVILMTPSDDDAYLSSTGKTGADALLPKRAVRAEILSRIRAVVGGFWSGWDGRDRRGTGRATGRWDGGERRRQPPREKAGSRPGGLLERVVERASLVFDSLREPLPAGVREGGPSARKLLYKAGRYLILLRMEPKADSGRLSVVGQVLDDGLPKKALRGLAVLALCGRTTVDRTLTNHLGEFQLEADSTANLRLSVGLPGTGPFIAFLGPVERKPQGKAEPEGARKSGRRPDPRHQP